jgi:hypothetical protein
MPRRLNLHHRALQQTSFRKRQLPVSHQRLGQNRLNLIALLCTGRIQRCHQPRMHHASRRYFHIHHGCGHLGSQRLTAKLQWLFELGKVNCSGVDVMRVHGKLRHSRSFQSMHFAWPFDLLHGGLPLSSRFCFSLPLFLGEFVLYIFLFLAFGCTHELKNLSGPGHDASLNRNVLSVGRHQFCKLNFNLSRWREIRIQCGHRPRWCRHSFDS